MSKLKRRKKVSKIKSYKDIIYMILGIKCVCMIWFIFVNEIIMVIVLFNIFFLKMKVNKFIFIFKLLKMVSIVIEIK